MAFAEPGYSYETVETAWHIATQFILPTLLGTKINQPEDILQKCRHVRGHPLAKATFDQAVDIVGNSAAATKKEKKPAWIC